VYAAEVSLTLTHQTIERKLTGTLRAGFAYQPTWLSDLVRQSMLGHWTIRKYEGQELDVRHKKILTYDVADSVRCPCWRGESHRCMGLEVSTGTLRDK
jgi:hypothetical protein